jgi:hypothetical protein
LLHALCTFELEGLGHNADRQNAQLAGGLSDDWGSTCTSTTAHTCGDETHMCAGKVIDDLFDALFRSGGTYGGPCACAQAFGHFQSHLDLCRGTRLLQCLCIGVRNNELGAIKLLLDHIIHGVTACATHTKYGNPWFQFVVSRKGKIQSHNSIRLFFKNARARGRLLLIKRHISEVVHKGHDKNTKSPPNMDKKRSFPAGYRRISKMLRITSYL